MKKYFVLVFTLTILLVYSTGLMAQNNCLDFDGTNDYVEANSLTTPLSSAGSFTIECWFNGDEISSSTGNQILWGINGPTSNPNTNIIMFAVHGDVLKVYDGNASGYTATTIIEQNNWYHVAFVKSSGNSFVVYLNGVEELTGSQTTAIPPGNTFSIGQEWDTNPSDFFDGKIDDFRVWNNARTETEIRQNMYKELVGNESGLFAYYKFNETSGTNANDEISNNNDGTLTDMDDSDWVVSSAMFGPKNTMHFGGNTWDTYVNCGANINPGDLSALTVECWVKPKAGSDLNYRRVFAQDGMNWLSIYQTSLKVYTKFPDGSSGKLSTSSLEEDKWTHLAMVWDGTTLSFYFNGIKDPSTYSFNSINSNTNSLLIGTEYVSDLTQSHYWGEMDEIRIWDDARTEAEIRENMCKILTGNEDNLITYYTFYNTSGTTLQDFSGNGYDGTIINSYEWLASDAFNTWLNTNNNSWSTTTNWSLGSSPSSSDNIGIYSYSGGTDVSLSGTPTVNILLLGGSSSMTLSSGVTVNGSLILESNLDLNGQTIYLSSSATLIEDSKNIYGNSGQIQTTRTLSDIDEDVAGLGAAITEDGNLGLTTIIRKHQAVASNAIKRTYQITTSNGPTNATLVFNYLDSELNGVTESNLVLYESADGNSWEAQSSSLNTTNNTISLSGINSFNYWTAGDGDNFLPVTLSSFTSDFINGVALLSWTTQSESNNLGWNIYRNDSSNPATAQQLNYLMIQGAGTTSLPTSYTYQDENELDNGATYWYWLESVSNTGESDLFDPISLIIENDEEEEETPDLPEYSCLHNNFPNPFNPKTEIRFDIKEGESGVLTISNVKGQTVKSLEYEAGSHSLSWDGSTAGSGVYFYSLKTPSYHRVGKMVMIK